MVVFVRVDDSCEVVATRGYFLFISAIDFGINNLRNIISK